MAKFWAPPEVPVEREAIIERSLDLACIASYCYKLDGTIVYLDRMCLQILDLADRYDDPAELIGSDLSDLLIYVRPKGELRQTIREHGHAYFLEYPFRTLSGKERWTLHNSCLYTDPTSGEEYIHAIIRDITEEKVARLALIESREALRRLARRAEIGREDERAALARDLHDDLGQQLVGLSLQLAQLRRHLPMKQSVLEQALEGLTESAKQAVRVVRRMCSGLRPPGLDDGGLVPAISWVIRDFEDRTGIAAMLVAPEALSDLDPDRATAVFRVLQELLSNVDRHAKASRVRVRLQKVADALMLEVEDDGRGIADADRRKRHSFGLVGITERLLAYGGEFEVSGVDGRGTRAVAMLPLGGTEAAGD